VLAAIAPGEADNLMVGFETDDDAAVYRLSDDSAALLTVDFFTPIVDDPYDFGRITAANALSDIYAMGGRPVACMNLLAFPCDLGPEVVGDVLRGGADKVREAGAVVVGGHTIEDKEPKYGLSVFGLIDPAGVVRNVGAQVGDTLFLTKPIGTGIMMTALKRGLETEDSVRSVIESMAELNRAASEVMVEVGVHAATDVTGFGLLGHLHEMLAGSGCAAEVHMGHFDVFDKAWEYAGEGVVPGRTADVIAWAQGFAEFAEPSDVLWRVLCDPQTSGGLLVAVAPEKAGAFTDMLERRTGQRVGYVGNVVAGEPGHVLVK